METYQKLFSIVIVNYNYAHFLEQCILSIINQSDDDYELIIIDGKSTDNSVEIIKKYESYISHWISEPDKGQSDAFNKGFNKAKGIFGFWINADDILMPRSIESAKKHIEKYPKINWFVGNSVFFNKENDVLACKNGICWNSFLIKNGPIPVYGPSSIFKISLLNTVGGFDENLHYTMDTDLWLRFVNHGERFKRIPHYIWGLRIHDSSKTAHAFSSAPTARFEKEREFILSKNKWRYSTFKIQAQKIYKLLLGAYFKSFINTYKYKHKQIDSI